MSRLKGEFRNNACAIGTIQVLGGLLSRLPQNADALCSAQSPSDVVVMDKIPLQASGKPDYPAETRAVTEQLEAAA